MRRMHFSLVVAAVGLLVINHSAFAADPVFPFGPAAGTIPNLPWVHLGTTITTRWYVANLIANPFTAQQDSSGTWTGSDGKSYSVTYNGDTMDAGGYDQTNVIALTPDKVALKTIVYHGGISAPVRAAPRQGGEVRALADTHNNHSWIDPSVLAQYKGDPAKHIYVTKVRWPEGNQIVDAIRIDSVQDQERLVIVYDANSGLGLQLSSLVPKGNGNTQLTEYNFVSLRDMQIPWASEPVPAVVRNSHSIHYSGQLSATVPYGLPPSDLTLTYSIVDSTAQWASFNSVGTGATRQHPQPVPDKEQLEYFGSAEFGGLWIGPGSVSMLRPGQVLDSDPITKVTTTVSQIDNQFVTITESSPVATIQKTYDRATGLLAGSDWADIFLKSRTIMRRDGLQ